jgi:hypothetical protein
MCGTAVLWSRFCWRDYRCRPIAVSPSVNSSLNLPLEGLSGATKTDDSKKIASKVARRWC